MLKKLIGYMRGYIKESILGPLFKLLEATFELFVPLVIASMIDNGIRLENTGHIWKMGGVLLLLGVVGLAFSITAQYFAARAAVGTSAIIRRTLFERVTRLSAQQLDKNGVSGLTQRLTGDVDQVQNGINLTLRLLLRSPFVVFGAMIMAFFVDAGSAWIFAVAIPVLGALVFGVMAWSLPLFRRAQQAMDLAMGITRENLTGARVIRAFGREKEENERFTNQAETLSDRKRRAGHVSALTGPLTCVVVNLALAALIYTGALRVDSGIISQGELVALVNYMSQILVELIKFA
ncbi:MAG: ABC transporter ATP-binding protein, partial [Clostridia bacterium]|nr:ABC transporter ATP-binding protein [Clostridia bacterium]